MIAAKYQLQKERKKKKAHQKYGTLRVALFLGSKKTRTTYYRQASSARTGFGQSEEAERAVVTLRSNGVPSLSDISTDLVS